MSELINIAVLGAGSWGTALAALLARNGQQATLWGRDSTQMKEMAACAENRRYLSGFDLPKNLAYSSDLMASVTGVEAILVATPSHTFRVLLKTLKPLLQPSQVLICACKGLEVGSGKFIHQIAKEELGLAQELALISGPTFAQEVMRGLPTAITVASDSAAVAKKVVDWLHGEHFRPYRSSDLVGVELGGALKNVLAIAAGIADGLGFGANTRAALVTRGLAEMMRLGMALDAKPETLMGLAGMGDLVLTCTDDLSRNRQMGLALARGLSVEEALEEIGQAVEGVKTAREAWLLAQRWQVDMPIVEQVYRVIYQQHSPKQAVQDLLSRDPRAEGW
ncbi:MAG: NAD(P)H-dependent glycerol-3-phosphate dehydrogenase [Gammaproteobacteria bacterium]|nr:NAD(P)H-dependent glycerol-3-phosphate dehydrogenase [Gammaproteobacteria bacterium]